MQLAWAGQLPATWTPYLVIAAAVTAAMVAARVIAPRVRASEKAWHVWNALLGVVGLVTVPQVLAGTFFGIGNLWPCLRLGCTWCDAALACDDQESSPLIALRCQVARTNTIQATFDRQLSESCGGNVSQMILCMQRRLSWCWTQQAGWKATWPNVWGVLSAWTATLLFCCQPIAQLARNFASPETVSSLSVATVLLATTGNGMMVPRALFTKDLVWSVGSLWGSLAMGWGNMLCVVMAGSTAAGYGTPSVQLRTRAVRLNARIRFTAHKTPGDAVHGFRQCTFQQHSI